MNLFFYNRGVWKCVSSAIFNYSILKDNSGVFLRVLSQLGILHFLEGCLLLGDMMDFLRVDYDMKGLALWAKGHPSKELRSVEMPFYTLGKNSYMDVENSAYHKDMGYWNVLLWGSHPILYVVVLKVLSDYMKEKVTLDARLSYPGFHIFLNDPVLMTIAGKWHTDIPHETLGLGDTDPMAYTLAIEMPEGGGGIDMCDGGYVEHKVGYMMIHDGQTIHRISPLKQEGVKDRITLQGHIIRRNGKLITFW